MTVGPQNRVFSIPELVELMLLHADTCTVLVSAQRVNKQWHNIIASSRKLQEALFFKPVENISFTKPNGTDTDPPHKSIPNPLIPKICIAITCQPEGQSKSILYHQVLARQMNESVYRRPEASWQRMLLRQPPSPYLGLFLMYYTGRSARVRAWAEGDNDGFRGQDLARLTLGEIPRVDIMITPELQIALVSNWRLVPVWEIEVDKRCGQLDRTRLATCDVVLGVIPRGTSGSGRLPPMNTSELVWNPFPHEKAWLDEQHVHSELEDLGVMGVPDYYDHSCFPRFTRIGPMLSEGVDEKHTVSEHEEPVPEELSYFRNYYCAIPFYQDYYGALPVSQGYYYANLVDYETRHG